MIHLLIVLKHKANQILTQHFTQLFFYITKNIIINKIL